MRRPEHALQVAVAHMLQVVLDPDRTWWSSIDHGVGKLGKAEAGIRKRRGVKAGIPDIIIMFADGLTDYAHLIGIELKAGKGSLSEAQEDVAAAWAIFGSTVFVARSLEEVQDILDHCGVPLRHRMHVFVRGHHVSAQRSAPPRHRRARRHRKSKNHLPLVLAHAAQKN